MKFDFFTFGGGYIWEDVFFYQKWRIQRNFKNKSCRLLDNWDIKRHEGSFDDCRRAFIRYIEAYELTRQKGHMIIMLPGLCESKNVFKPLWRAALEDNYMAAALNYPSTKKKIEGHVRQIDFFLNHLEDVEKVSFVTNGLGGVILQALFSLNTEWKQKLKIGRIVEVNPLNHGNILLKKLSKNKFMSFILGPVAGEMDPRRIEQILHFPPEIERGVILSDSFVNKLVGLITGVKLPQISIQSEKANTGAKEVIKLKNYKLNIFKNPNVVKKTMDFLKKGHFE